jgi:septal ring factor EnvC (AmiA/AmiB activator)
MVSGLFSRLIIKGVSLLQPVNLMKTVNDTDRKRLEDLIINGQKAIESSIDAIKADIGEIKTDIKEIKQDVKSLEIGQVKLTERVEGMDTRLKTVEGSQKNQIWALITILGGSLITASVGLLIAILRFVFFK